MISGERGVIDFAIRNRIHLAPGAILIIWALPPWYGSRPSWVALPVVLLVGFGVYQLNRVFDFVEDEINDPGAYVKTFPGRAALRRMAIAAMLASILLSIAFMGRAATALLAMIILAGILYSVPFLGRGKEGRRRLKQVISLKNAIPSVVWPVATILYPAMSTSGVHLLQLFLAIALVSSSVFTIEVAWDIRDSRGDRAAGIGTLANTLGLNYALAIPFAVSCGFALASALLAYSGSLTPIWLFPGILPGMLAAIAFLWRDPLAGYRDRSHILVLINILALIPLGLAGRWGG